MPTVYRLINLRRIYSARSDVIITQRTRSFFLAGTHDSILQVKYAQKKKRRLVADAGSMTTRTLHTHTHIQVVLPVYIYTVSLKELSIEHFIRSITQRCSFI